MKRRSLSIAGAIGIILGVALLRFGLLSGVEGNWVPTQLPFPGAMTSVSDEFSLVSGGSFNVEVLTAASADERRLASREGAVRPTKLVLTVDGARGAHLTRTIDRLDLNAWTRDTNFYSARMQLELPAGKYDITVRNDSGTIPFPDRGALVRLERMAPSGHELAASFFCGVAYLCFAAAIALILSAAFWPQ
jgi:hypothetical protein